MKWAPCVYSGAFNARERYGNPEPETMAGALFLETAWLIV